MADDNKRKIDTNLSDTEFQTIPHLQDGTNLDGFKRIGVFVVRDPIGLAPGDYFLTNYISSIGGARRAVQIVENVITGTQQFRAKADGGWTSWATRAAGGIANTNISVSATSNSVSVESDTGNDATIAAANGTLAGVMSASDYTKLAGIEAGATADQSGSEIVSAIDTQLGSADWRASSGAGSTNLSTTRNATTVTVASDTGTDATLPAADATDAGVMTAAQFSKLSGIEAGATADQTGSEIVSAIDTQLGSADWRASSGAGSTNLSTTRNATTVTVASDTGTDATLPAADATDAGVMTAAQFSKLSGIEAGATADQTGSEIVSAIDTQLGSTGWRGAGTTNLGYSADADSVQITSDTGSDVDILAATNSSAGVMAATDKSHLDSLYALIGNIPSVPSRVFNVLNYGALPDGGSAAAATNRTAFENAILAAEAAGGGQIYAPRGTYYISYGGAASVGGVRLRSNMHLVGDGMGITTIKAADIGNNDMAGLVRTQSGIENTNIVVRDLTIDGNKGEQTGWANIICFFAGVTPDDRVHMDRDIWCINVECKNGKNGTTGSSNLTRGYGFDPHEVVDRFVAVNCIAHDCERDGFVLDGVLNFQLIGCKSWNSGRHNFNFITTTFNGEVVGCHAWDCGQLGTGNNFTVQSNSSNITFTGCRSRNALENGFRIRAGDVVTNTYVKMVGCFIENSQKNGLQLTGAAYNTIQNCTFYNNSQAGNFVYFDISLDEDDGDTGVLRGASFNVIQGNLAYRDGVVGPKSAYRESDTATVLPHDNYFSWNEAYNIGGSTGYQYSKYHDTLPATAVRDRGYLDVYNVKDHGAKGDGVTDDGAAIRDLVDVIVVRGGGVLYFPNGHYMVSPPGTAASTGYIAIPNTVSVLGESMDHTIIEGMTTSVSMTGVLRTKSGQQCVGTFFENISLIGPSTTNSVDIPVLYIGDTSLQAQKISVRNVSVSRGQNGASSGGYGIRLSNVAKAVLDNVNSTSNERDGIYVEGCVAIKAINCISTNNSRHGILVDSSTDVDVVSPYCNGNVTNGILMQGDNMVNVRVVGGGVHSSGEDGVRIRRSNLTFLTDCAVLGVSITNNGRDGVSTAGAHRNRIEGCTFVNNGQTTTNTYNDVSLEKDSTFTATLSEYNVVSNNTMFAAATNKTKYAISESALAGDNNKFIGNYGSGQVTSFYNIVGANTHKLDWTNIPAAGGSGHIQYRDATGYLAGGANFTYDAANSRAIASNGLQINNAVGGIPASSGVLIQADSYGAFSVPSWTNIAGDTTRLSRGFPGNITIVTPANIGATTVNTLGGSFTLTGAVGRAFASTNKLTSARRVGFDTTTTPGTITSVLPSSGNYCWRGNAVGLGGFFYEILFGFVAGTPTNDSKGFFGLSGTTTSLVSAGAAINVTANYIGLAKTTGDSGLSLIGNDNSGTGASLYTFTTAANDFSGGTARLFRFVLYAPANSSSIYFNLDNVITGVSEGGSVTGANLPSNGSMLSPHLTFTNGGDGVNNQWDFIGMYLENRGL